MEISKSTKIDLVREIKALIDENEDSVQVLEHAYALAQTIANLLSKDGIPDNLGFSLGEYAYEKLDVAKGDAHKTAWIEKNNTIITNSIENFERDSGENLHT